MDSTFSKKIPKPKKRIKNSSKYWYLKVRSLPWVTDDYNRWDVFQEIMANRKVAWAALQILNIQLPKGPWYKSKEDGIKDFFQNCLNYPSPPKQEQPSYRSFYSLHGMNKKDLRQIWKGFKGFLSITNGNNFVTAIHTGVEVMRDINRARIINREDRTLDKIYQYLTVKLKNRQETFHLNIHITFENPERIRFLKSLLIWTNLFVNKWMKSETFSALAKDTWDLHINIETNHIAWTATREK